MILINLDREEVEECRRCADIRSTTSTGAKTTIYVQDQNFFGCLGECAACKHYRVPWENRAHLDRGQPGPDIVIDGWGLDVKTRSEYTPGKIDLIVSPRAFHPDTHAYLGAAVKAHSPTSAQVVLLGWAWTEAVLAAPRYELKKGHLPVHVVPVSDLKPPRLIVASPTTIKPYVLC